MSPFRSSAGPATVRMPTPSSSRMINASVVLPSPGGPTSRTWSSASPRAFAASSAIASCSLTRSWPTNSSRRRGRSERSSSSSSAPEHRARANCVAHAACSAPAARAPRPAARDRPRRAPARPRRPSSRARRARRARSRATDVPAALEIGTGSPRRRASPSARARPARPSSCRCRGSAWNRAVSSSTIARRSSAGGEPETIASATFGPIPATREQLHGRARARPRRRSRRAGARPRARADRSRRRPRRLAARPPRTAPGVAATR